MNGVPGVAALGDTRRRSGLALSIRTSTPPCCVAPRNAYRVPVECSPDPTLVGYASKPIPGVVTTIVRVATNCRNPGEEALMFTFPAECCLKVMFAVAD